jgi:hypothetical protein
MCNVVIPPSKIKSKFVVFSPDIEFMTYFPFDNPKDATEFAENCAEKTGCSFKVLKRVSLNDWLSLGTKFPSFDND